MKTKTILLSIALAVMAQVLKAQHFGWAKQVGGTHDEYTYAIARDASGNLYTTGAFRGTMDFDPGTGTFNMTSAGDYDIFIFKLDASGNFVWAKQLGGSGSDWGLDITVDASGNIYTTGIFAGTADFDPGVGTHNLIVTTGGTNLFVSKLDASGNFVWAKQSGGNAQGSSIRTDGSGNVYTSGHFQFTTDFDPGAGTFNLTSAGGRDGFIFKWDAMGNFVWAKQLGGTLDDVADELTVDGFGNVLTVGYFSGKVDFDPGAGADHFLTAVAGDIFVSKLDALGNFVWAKQLGGTDLDWGYSIATDASGNVFTTGYFQKNADFDPGAGTFYLNAVASDIFISKLDAMGNFVWAKQSGGSSEFCWGKSITTDATGNVYTTGAFAGTADFDPGVNTMNLTSSGDHDAFISKLDAAGNYVWAKQVGGTLFDQGVSLVTDGSGNVYTVGDFKGTACDFDPGSGTFNLISAGGGDAFVLKLTGTHIGLSKNSLVGEISFYPNPTKGQFQMVFNKEMSNVQVTVRNMVGQEVDSKHYLSAQTIQYTLDGEAGLYYVEISSQGEKATYKIVKE